MSAETSGRGLRPAKAAEHIGIGVSTLWNYAKTVPDFPRPVKVSSRVTIFRESEIDAWLASRATTRVAA